MGVYFPVRAGWTVVCVVIRGTGSRYVYGKMLMDSAVMVNAETSLAVGMVGLINTNRECHLALSLPQGCILKRGSWCCSLKGGFGVRSGRQGVPGNSQLKASFMKGSFTHPEGNRGNLFTKEARQDGVFRNPTAEPVPQQRVPVMTSSATAMPCLFTCLEKASGLWEVGTRVYKTAILLVVVSNISKYM